MGDEHLSDNDYVKKNYSYDENPYDKYTKNKNNPSLFYTDNLATPEKNQTNNLKNPTIYYTDSLADPNNIYTDNLKGPYDPYAKVNQIKDEKQ